MSTPYYRWRMGVADLALDTAGLAVFDTETTGFKFFEGGHKVVSLCVLHATLREAEPAVAFFEFIHPGRAIPAAATRVHGISTVDMDLLLEAGEALYFPAHAKRVLDVFGARIQVAHNLEFDAKALRSEFRLPAPSEGWLPRGVCTYALSWAAWPHAKSHKLGDLCALIGHDLTNAHDAKADSIACFRVFQAAVKVLRERHPIHTVGELLSAQDEGVRLRRASRRNR